MWYMCISCAIVNYFDNFMNRLARPWESKCVIQEPMQSNWPGSKTFLDPWKYVKKCELWSSKKSEEMAMRQFKISCVYRAYDFFLWNTLDKQGVTKTKANIHKQHPNTSATSVATSSEVWELATAQNWLPESSPLNMWLTLKGYSTSVEIFECNFFVIWMSERKSFLWMIANQSSIQLSQGGGKNQGKGIVRTWCWETWGKVLWSTSNGCEDNNFGCFETPPMCVSPLGGARVTRKVAILPIHTSGMARLVYEAEMIIIEDLVTWETTTSPPPTPSALIPCLMVIFICK